MDFEICNAVKVVQQHSLKLLAQKQFAYAFKADLLRVCLLL